MKTENLSIVFVDIAGFTPTTSSQTRLENERMLRRFDGLVRPLVRAYRGRVVKTIGDAYLLTFRSPTDAVLCSTVIHDGLAEANAQVDDSERFNIRAAVNVGEVRLEGGDVYGEAVNIAARIEGKTGAGEVYFSEAVYLAMTRSEVPAEEVGYFELKGIAEKVRLYRVPRVEDGGGYALKHGAQGMEPHRSDATQADARSALAPPALPFAGLGLAPVRDRLGSVVPVPISSAQLRITTTAFWQRAVSVSRPAMSLLWQACQRWWSLVRRSRTWQVVTAAILCALVGLTVWGVWPEKPKPQTPWQQLQRRLGLD